MKLKLCDSASRNHRRNVHSLRSMNDYNVRGASILSKYACGEIIKEAGHWFCKETKEKLLNYPNKGQRPNKGALKVYWRLDYNIYSENIRAREVIRWLFSGVYLDGAA